MADISELTKTTDVTETFESSDIESNKIMGVLAYIGILVLIPILAAPNSKFARFHANQGLVLAIADIILAVLSRIPVIGILASLCSLVCFILSIMGIINAATGKAKQLPLVGGFTILK